MQESGVDANVVTFNSLMTIIAKSAAAGDIPDAGAALSQGTQVVGMMLTSDISPNIITFNALVTAIVKAGVASREGCKEELAGALNLMAQAEVQPNSVTSVLLMDWFVADGLTISESGPAAVELLEEVGLEADCGSFKTMVDTCARSGNGVRHIIPILEVGRFLAQSSLSHDPLCMQFVFLLVSTCKDSVRSCAFVPRGV